MGLDDLDKDKDKDKGERGKLENDSDKDKGLGSGTGRPGDRDLYTSTYMSIYPSIFSWLDGHGWMAGLN